MVFHEGAAYLDGVVDVTEFCRAVAGHEEGVGVVVLVCREGGGDACCRKQQREIQLLHFHSFSL